MNQYFHYNNWLSEATALKVCPQIKLLLIETKKNIIKAQCIERDSEISLSRSPQLVKFNNVENFI